MQVQFYSPRNNLLKEYMEGYYFITKKKIGNPVIYWTFPNNYCIAAVYQNTELKLEENRISVSASMHENIASSLVSRYVSPIEIVQNDVTDEITIYFKPLGINSFIDDVQKLFSRNIIEFDPFPDYREEMNRVFNIRERELQIDAFEDYWIKKIIRKNMHPIKDILSDVESDKKISEIAEKYNMSRQYLNKYFRNHLGKSPSEFRKIHRFRTSIAQKGKNRNLTELAYDSLFYDQSHFIKDFKQFTTLNPSRFFHNVDTGKENVWLMLD